MQHEGPGGCCFAVGHGGLRGVGLLLQGRGQRADAAQPVDVAHRGVAEAGVATHGRHQPRGQQRMAAQVAEEVHVAAHLLAREQALQRGEQHVLGGGLGGVRVHGRARHQRQRAQGLAVGLARGDARHRRQPFEVRWHHVGRQQRGQRVAQCLGQRRGVGRGSVAAWHQVGDQVVNAVLGPQQHGRRADAGLLRQHRLDLAELDAEAADLHLVVRAPQALHLAGGVDAGQVTSAVQARVVGAFGPGVGQELARRQLRAAQVALGHARAGDAQLADGARRQQLQRRRCARRPVGVDDRLHHHQHVVGQRPADGHRLAGPQLGQAGRHRGLGRPVSVEDLAARTSPTLHQGRRTHLAAQVDDAQPGHVVREQRQQRGHGMQNRHPVVGQQARQQIGVAGSLRRADPQRGADQVADPDFLERHVEGD